MKRRLGLRARFIGLILILLTAMFSTIAAILINTNTSSLRKDLQDRSKAFATLATTPIGNTFETYQDSGTYLIGRQIRTFEALDPTISNIAIVDLEGGVQFSSGALYKKVNSSDASSFTPEYQYSGNTISRIIYPYISQSGGHSYAVVYDVSSDMINAAVTHLVKSIVVESIIGLIVSAAIMSLLVNRFFLDPIKQVRDRAMTIAAGDYSQQIPHERSDEIGDLAGSVNQMADRLKADIHKLQEVDQVKSEFMMIASHNLRTPLTAINGYLSLAETQALTGQLKQLIGSIEANSQRLSTFAEDLLTISGMESGQKVFSSEQITIDSMLTSIAKEAAVLAGDKKLQFEADIQPSGAKVLGSKPHLRGAVWNLLDNALKFTKEGGTVSLSLQRKDDSLQITVKDTGIGISSEEIDKLFTKFHRGTSTLQYNYEGTGIGLYVTKLIINQHHGFIHVDSTLGKGSTFTITLPVVSEDAPDTSEKPKSESKA